MLKSIQDNLIPNFEQKLQYLMKQIYLFIDSVKSSGEQKLCLNRTSVC